MATLDHHIGSHQSRNIEFLRGSAAILVVLSHMHSTFNIKLGWLAVNGGWLGVQMFFVISGYLIIKSAAKYSGSEYVIHRFFRIWPAYIFWFLAIGITTGALGTQSISDPSLYPHILLMQHLFPHSYLKYDVLRTSWTLTVEIIWYAAAFFLTRAGGGRKLYLLVTLASVAVATWWVYDGKRMHPLWGTWEPIYDYFFINNIFIAQLPFFIFGALIALPGFRLSLPFCLATAVIILFTYDDWISDHNPIFLSGIAISAIFYIAVTLQHSFQSRLVSFFSDISYSVYLVHYPIILFVVSKMQGGYFSALVAFLATIITAWASYLLIEKPFINFGRNLSRRVKTARTAHP